MRPGDLSGRVIIPRTEKRRRSLSEVGGNGMLKGKAAVAALGTFDGVHLGHREVLLSSLHFGDFVPVCFSFHGTPKAAMGIDAPLLLSEKDRIKKIREIGIEDIVLFDFEKIKNYTAEDFLNFLTEEYNVRGFCCGFNYRFGAGGSGDTKLLARYCERNGFPLKICEPVKINGTAVSASEIRRRVQSGEMRCAGEMLGYPYFFEGEVYHGFRRGHELGFPTVNQKIPLELCLPRFGVYSSFIYIKGLKYRGLTNIGVNPTFNLPAPGAETYVFGFSKEIYGERVKIELLDFVRGEMRFDSIDELRYRISLDVETAKKHFGE